MLTTSTELKRIADVLDALNDLDLNDSDVSLGDFYSELFDSNGDTIGFLYYEGDTFYYTSEK